MNDIRSGLRQVRQAPAYAALVIVTIAIGIGATTTLFSVVDGVLLKPLPWPRAERLVRVTETRQGRTGRVAGTVSNATFLAWRDHPDTIEDLGGWLTQTATMTGAGDPVRVSVLPTTASLFAILRARPLIGRLFVEGDGARDQPGLVILSYGLWQERFGGRPEIVGNILQFDDKPYTIVGVMPREFAFPDRETRAWTAWSVPPLLAPNGMQVGVIFRAVARLRDGATFVQAAAEATSRARRARHGVRGEGAVRRDRSDRRVGCTGTAGPDGRRSAGDSGPAFSGYAPADGRDRERRRDSAGAIDDAAA